MDEDSRGAPTRTRAGTVLGTPLYMSPEQFGGRVTVDHRSDIYALGCILFEMVCGRPPFTGEGFADLAVSHVSRQPPGTRSLQPECPVDVDELVHRMLAKDPDARLQSMRVLVTEIDAIVSTLPAATVPGAAPGAALRSPVGGTSPTRIGPASPNRHPLVNADQNEPVKRVGRGAILSGIFSVVVVAGGIGIWRASPTDPPSPNTNLPVAPQASRPPDVSAPVAAPPAPVVAAPPPAAPAPRTPRRPAARQASASASRTRTVTAPSAPAPSDGSAGVAEPQVARNPSAELDSPPPPAAGPDNLNADGTPRPSQRR